MLLQYLLLLASCFLLFPCPHASDDVIDYSTFHGMKLYSASIATSPIKDLKELAEIFRLGLMTSLSVLML
jgi:hypothetical protein